MAEITSLNRARKAKARADRVVQADANRVKFGRTKAQRKADDAAAANQNRLLDGAKREN